MAKVFDVHGIVLCLPESKALLDARMHYIPARKLSINEADQFEYLVADSIFESVKYGTHT